MKPIITLTTDLGATDYYSGLLKAALVTVDPTLPIVDISHQIAPFDIVQAAFVVKNCFDHFPKGTLHIIGVNTLYEAKPVFLIARHKEHYFLVPDNGILSLLFDPHPTDIYELPYSGQDTFPICKVISTATKHLLGDQPFNEIGIPIEAIEQRLNLRPVTSGDFIRGSVIHIDRYQNVVTNISQALFKRLRKKRSFTITFKRHDPIKKIHTHYAQVAIGEPLCLFNSAGLLEIAVHMGKASSLLGLLPDDMVQIEFND